VRQAAAAIPVEAGRHALEAAYQSGFVSTFDHLMAIAAAVALVGGVGCLFLVRQKDFVPSIGDSGWSSAGDGDGSGDGDAAEWSAAAHAG